MGRFCDGLVERKRAGFVPVIPDFKAFSPKEGDLFDGRNPVDAARLLVGIGAPVISVVTEEINFGGSLKLLENIVNATGVPVLRKDFIKCVDDLRITKECGADAVLLICSTLTEDKLTELYSEALSMGLEPFVETRSRDELVLAGKLGAELVGINNRNILELERDSGDVGFTKELSQFRPSSALLVSESGIFTREDVNAALKAGADAVLVGTALWRADSMETLYLTLCGADEGTEL